MSMLSTYFPMAAVAGIVTSSAKWSPEIFSSLLFQSSESGVWDERLAGFKLSWCLALTKHALISLALTVKRKKFPRRAVSWVFEKKSVWFRRLFSSKFNSRFVIFRLHEMVLGRLSKFYFTFQFFSPMARKICSEWRSKTLFVSHGWSNKLIVEEQNWQWVLRNFIIIDIS